MGLRGLLRGSRSATLCLWHTRSNHGKLLAEGLRSWHSTLTSLQAYPSAPEVGFPALLLGQYYQVGLRSMCLAGLPSFIAAQASFEIIAALNVAERLTRLSMAISTSRSVRRMSSAVAALVEYCWPDLLDIFTLPLQAHAYLQALGLLYPGYALPPLRSFNPLSPASPLAVSSPSLSTISSLSGVLSSTAVMLWTFEKLRRTLMTYLFESMPSVLQIVKIDMSSFSAGYQGEVIPYGWPSPQGEPDLESPAITPNAGPASDTRNAQPRSGPAPTPRPETNPDIVVTARTSSVDRTQGSLLITLEVQNADNTERNGAHAGYAVQEELSGADDDAQERRLLNEDRASGNRFPVTDVAYLCESLNSHLTRLVGNTIMLPLRMLLLQRMLLSFSPATYSWHVPSQSILWYPKTGREMYTLGGRLLICCGLECATRMALWLGEVAIVIWQRRRTARLMRNDDGNIESDSSEVHT